MAITDSEYRREVLLACLEVLADGGYGVLLGAALGLAALVRALELFAV